MLDAREWYDNIRSELGERFALAVEATVEALAEHPLPFHVVYRNSRFVASRLREKAETLVSGRFRVR